MNTNRTSKLYDWDINDSNLPKFNIFHNFEEWIDGHSKLIYNLDNDLAKKHSSGWAMRNTNNHNVQILKKSCLGVLICTKKCYLENEEQIHIRPAICDKARKKQQGKPCPNPKCNGKLEVMQCTGNGGYPVTHFWRHHNNFILFQSKGNHNHPRPEPKSSSDIKKTTTLKILKNSSSQNANYIRKYNKNKSKPLQNLYQNENKKINTKICKNNIVINKYNSFNYINAILPQANVTSFVNSNLTNNHSNFFGNSINTTSNHIQVNNKNQLLFNQNNLINSNLQTENCSSFDISSSFTKSNNSAYLINSASNSLNIHQTEEQFNDSTTYNKFLSSSLNQSLNYFLPSNLTNNQSININSTSSKITSNLPELSSIQHQNSTIYNQSISKYSNFNKSSIDSNELDQQYLSNQKSQLSHFFHQQQPTQSNKFSSCLSSSNYSNFSSPLSSSSSSNSSLDCVHYYRHHQYHHYSRSHFSLQQIQSQQSFQLQNQNQQQYQYQQQHDYQNQQSFSYYEQQQQQQQNCPQQNQQPSSLNNYKNFQYIDKESVDNYIYTQQNYFIDQPQQQQHHQQQQQLQQQQQCELQSNIYERDFNKNNTNNEMYYLNSVNENFLYDRLNQQDNFYSTIGMNESDYYNRHENNLSNIDSNYYWNSQNHETLINQNNKDYSYLTQPMEDSCYSADSNASLISNYLTPTKQTTDYFKSTYSTLNNKKKFEKNHELISDCKLNYLNYSDEENNSQNNNLKQLEHENKIQSNKFENIDIFYTSDFLDNSFVIKEKKNKMSINLVDYNQMDSDNFNYSQQFNLHSQNQNSYDQFTNNSLELNTPSIALNTNFNTNNLFYNNFDNNNNNNNLNDINNSDINNINNNVDNINNNLNNNINNNNLNLTNENCAYSHPHHEQQNLYQVYDIIQTPNECSDDYVVTYLK